MRYHALRFFGFCAQQRARIIAALNLLGRLAVGHLRHLAAEVSEIEYAPYGGPCPTDAVACAGSHYGRRVFLVNDPLAMTLVELAVVLSHEARHLLTLPTGQLVTVPHHCDPCMSAEEQEIDPIYQEDAILRTYLEDTLAREEAQRQPPFWGFWPVLPAPPVVARAVRQWGWWDVAFGP